MPEFPKHVYVYATHAVRGVGLDRDFRPAYAVAYADGTSWVTRTVALVMDRAHAHVMAGALAASLGIPCHIMPSAQIPTDIGWEGGTE